MYLTSPLFDSFDQPQRETTMKMNKSAIAIATMGITAFASQAAMAAGSAKFAATWTDSPALASMVQISDATVDTVLVDSKNGYTLATIKVPQDKELLVGVSAEIGLVTYGSVKGKNGGSAKSLADAKAYVNIFAVPTGSYDQTTNPVGSIQAPPGQIMLSKRIQELSATLGGVIQSCTDSLTEDTDGDGIADATDGTIDIATECTVTDEEIGLLQDTTAAHHFNLVLPNMDQGEYDIVAVFTTGARAQVDICDLGDNCAYDPEGTVSASAEAKAVINKTMLTVQQVRATKGGLIDTDISEL
jgi:hypothetical protein